MPITVIVPIETTPADDFAVKQSVKLLPALPYRLFVHVPHEAVYAGVFAHNFAGVKWAISEFKIKSHEPVNVTKIQAHFMQNVPDLASRNSEHHKVCTRTYLPANVTFFRYSSLIQKRKRIPCSKFAVAALWRYACQRPG